MSSSNPEQMDSGITDPCPDLEEGANQQAPRPKPLKEWTLMFYFASANPLAPGVVSQLKALKNAGFDPNVNVIAHFDPQPRGTPTHVFDINFEEKLRRPTTDSKVSSLLFDKLWRDELRRDKKKKIRDSVIEHYNKPPKPPQPVSDSNLPVPPPPTRKTDRPNKSLEAFLNFCAINYPAKHYMLFILGHGLVVGNDIFLYDEHTSKHSVTLRQLGKALRSFKRTMLRGSQLELVSFHSCSLSSLEVAYELRKAANYMLASQGPAFVGSWPYEAILRLVFKAVPQNNEERDGDRVKSTVEGIFDRVLRNSTDFMLAGYSFDLCLCDLRNIDSVMGPLIRLCDALIAALGDKEEPDYQKKYGMVINCIVLSHWKSQSHWQEHYTDLYDLCFCLKKYCEQFRESTTDQYEKHLYEVIESASALVMSSLKKEKSIPPDSPMLVTPREGAIASADPQKPFVVYAECAGPESQYSHGLSIYFPWARPTGDEEIIRAYKKYKFDREASWLTFLNKYWDKPTLRTPHSEEEPRLETSTEESKLKEDMLSLMFNGDGPLSNVKTHPTDPTGDECTCGSLKNHPHDTRKRSERSEESPDPTVPFSSSPFI